MNPTPQAGLAAITTLRREAVRQAQVALEQAHAAAQAAEALAGEARAELTRHTTHPPPTPDGCLTGAEVRRVGAYREHHQRQTRQLERRGASALATVQQAHAAVSRAREALRRAHAEEQLVDRFAARKRAEARQRAAHKALDEEDERLVP